MILESVEFLAENFLKIIPEVAENKAGNVLIARVFAQLSEQDWQPQGNNAKIFLSLYLSRFSGDFWQSIKIVRFQKPHRHCS